MGDDMIQSIYTLRNKAATKQQKPLTNICS